MKNIAIVAVFVFMFMGGMPALHGVDGKTFGGLVSGLAKTNPMALVAHVTGK